MPSFDIKSGINFHEVTNGVDQANRIIQNRFDFKGTGATISLEEGSFVLQSQQEFQLHQMLPILRESLAKRGVGRSPARAPCTYNIINSALQLELFLGYTPAT